MNERIYNSGKDKLRMPERIERLEVEKVVNLCLQDPDNKTLLDIGTGTGVFAEAFDKAGLTVSGIDLNEEMIQTAKFYLPKTEFIIAKAEDIPFEDDRFDASFFGLVFHEVSDYKKALSEAFRVSRSNTFILEWKYKTEDFGPPLEHRLKPEFIKNLAHEIGYKTFLEIPLTNLVLYLLTKDFSLI
jgi:ubiquinone/menaquinone biosynthesis C-methylase UbiE